MRLIAKMKGNGRPGFRILEFIEAWVAVKQRKHRLDKTTIVELGNRAAGRILPTFTDARSLPTGISPNQMIIDKDGFILLDFVSTCRSKWRHRVI
jgi:hypothetical protein